MVKLDECKVIVSENGPYLVFGNLPLKKEIIVIGKEGEPIKWKKTKTFSAKKEYSLCRCGNSGNKPYCDGTHLKIKFDGTETASRQNYIEGAKKIIGPNLILTDNVSLCSSARFCNRAGNIWNLVKNSDEKSKDIAIQESFDCPSGRLVIWNIKTGKPIEPKFKPSISIIEDPQKNVSGGLWLKGNILVESSDGKKYEIRNRVNLCRCGKSTNKPFCNGNHISFGFKD